MGPGAGKKYSKLYAPVCAEQRRRREVNRLRSEEYLQKFYARYEFDEPFLYGCDVYADDGFAGNCSDMAAYAAWFATWRRIGTAWLAVIEDPGDHIFCIIAGVTRPRWDCVANFRNDRTDAWVIDPWANICCPVRDYETQFNLKMDKWTQRGKRIYYQSRVYRADGWAVPNCLVYRNGFLRGPIDYLQAIDPETK